VPRYLLINETEPKWRLHDTMDSADLEKSLARVIQNGVITYTLASRNEGGDVPEPDHQRQGPGDVRDH